MFVQVLTTSIFLYYNLIVNVKQHSDTHTEKKKENKTHCKTTNTPSFCAFPLTQSFVVRLNFKENSLL